MTSALPGTTDDLPPYPGRGLVIGSLASGHPFWLYFVTGRNANSLERRAALGVDGTITIEPLHRPAHDELLHYVAARPLTDGWLVGNGTQVEGVGNVDLDSLPAAFSEWEHEPDPPIWTPRIIAAIGTGTPPRFVAATARRIASGATDHLWHTGEAATSTAVRMHTYTGPISRPMVSWSASARSITARIRPSKITATRSDRLSTSSRSSLTSSTPTPRLAASTRTPRTVSMAPTSRPRVGEAATSTAVRMHTYTGPVHEPQPDGTTTWVTTADDLDHAADQMWDALSPDRRVLVAARDLTSGEFVCRHRT